MADKRKLLNRGDFLIVITILAAALAWYIFTLNTSSSGAVCKIVADGVEDDVDLNIDRQFSLDEKPAVLFEIKDHSIAFIHSDCPDKVCVNSGYIKIPGEISACVPNNVLIKIVSDETLDIYSPDMIAK